MNKNIYKSNEGKAIIINRYDTILSSWPVENKQYTVETSVGNTFVIESGSRSNPPILLIHGSTSNSYCWIGDVEELSKRYNVFAIDIIGEAGYSEEIRPLYESGDYAKWLLSLMSMLGIESASIVGLSLGGWMALNLATEYPEKIDQLILLCPGGLYQQRSSFLFKAVFYSLLGKWGRKQVMKLINGGVEAGDDGLEEALEFTALISKHFNPRMDKLPIYSADELNKLTMPVLVIYGAKDYLLNAEKSIDNIEQNASNVQSVLLKDTGHVVTNQTQRILSFLK